MLIRSHLRVWAIAVLLVGAISLVGRADDMFVCGGENVYPGEVEKLLECHPDILQAAVLPAEDDIKGMIPIAFVTGVPGRSIDVDAVRAFTIANGPAFRHPRAIVVLDKLPIGGTHKIDRSALRLLAQTTAAGLNR